MAILDETVQLKWHNRFKKYYTTLGYTYTKVGDCFDVKVSDLQKGCELEVLYKCDYCGEIGKRMYKSLITSRKAVEKDCCSNPQCMSLKRKDAKLSKGGSLSDKFPLLAKQWDYENNSKTPFDYLPHSKEKVWWVCEQGHKWEAVIQKRTTLNRGCHYCAGRLASEDNNLEIARPDISAEWDFENNEGLRPRDVTFSSSKRVLWKCSKGHSWGAKVSNRVNGSGCPKCSMSNGEKFIHDWLTDKNIRFEMEFEFDGLLGEGYRSLRFDFAIFDDQNILEILIEFDGEFHFKEYYGYESYLSVVEHDRRKNEFCHKNNIPLLRIPYTKYKMLDEILTNNLLQNIVMGGCLR